MEYAQLNQELTEATQVTTHGNVEWDATHFCPASALTEEEAKYFRVVPLTVTEPPTFDPITQSVMRNGCEQVGGVWQYRWDVVELFGTQAEKEAAIATALQAAKDAKWEQVRTKRDELSDTGGYRIVVEGVDKWLHSDAKSKTQQIALLLMGANVPAVPWKTLDGSFITMTQAIASAIFQAATAKDVVIFQAAETHLGAINTSSDPAGYDFSTGWPTSYVA